MEEISNNWLKEFIYYHKPSSSFLDIMKNVKTRGLFHSVQFLRMEDKSAVFAIDLGSSGIQGFHHLLNCLDEGEVVISEVEI